MFHQEPRFRQIQRVLRRIGKGNEIERKINVQDEEKIKRMREALKK